MPTWSRESPPVRARPVSRTTDPERAPARNEGTRERIIATTARHLGELGPRALELKTVCGELEISPSLVNYYFASPAELIWLAAIYGYTEHVAAQQAAFDRAKTGAAALEGWVRGTIDWTRANPGLAAVIDFPMLALSTEGLATADQFTKDLSGLSRDNVTTLGSAVWSLMKGQPLAYNKDNQEDKEPLFDTVDTVLDTLRIFADMATGITVKADAMGSAALQGYATATDLADYLVKKGLPFRDAHEAVAHAVRSCEQRGCDLADLTQEELQRFSSLIEADVQAALTLEGSVAARAHVGGTAPAQVRAAIARLQAQLQSPSR